MEDAKDRNPTSHTGAGVGFYRNPNAVLEGYHSWDVHAFPLELYDAVVGGRDFGVSCTNSPVRATMTGALSATGTCIPDARGWVHCDCEATDNRRVSQKVPDYQNYGDLFFKPNVGSPVYFNYMQRVFHPNHPDHIPPPTTPGDYDDYEDRSVFRFNGLFKNVTQTWDSQGRTFQVTVEDPRVILEGTKILLGEKFTKPTVPADYNFSKDAVVDFHDGKSNTTSGNAHRHDRPIDNRRGLGEIPGMEGVPVNLGYEGYYNILNVFGYYDYSWNTPVVYGNESIRGTQAKKSFENSGKGAFGDADYTSIGMVWYEPEKIINAPFGAGPSHSKTRNMERHEFGIIPALQFMLMGDGEEYLRLNEPMGGPIYYGTDNLNTDPRMEAVLMHQPDDPDNLDKSSPYRYKVDLSDLYLLHKVKNPGRAINMVDDLRGECLNDALVPTSHKSLKACEAAGFVWQQWGICYDKPLPDGEEQLSDVSAATCTAAGLAETPSENWVWESYERTIGHSGGNLDSTLRIDETEISLLSLIQTICEEAGADFFVELLRDPLPKEIGGTGYVDWEGHVGAVGPYNQESTYAGTIKIRVIPRAKQNLIIPNIVREVIDESIYGHKGYWTEEQFDGSGDSLGYREPIIENASVGYEFNDVVTGVMMIGGPRTRVVGVTPQGGIKFRYDESFDYNGDGIDDFFTDEYLPSTEFDGGWLGYVTGSIPREPQATPASPGHGVYTDERFANGCRDFEGNKVAENADSRDDCLDHGECLNDAGDSQGQKTKHDCEKQNVEPDVGPTASFEFNANQWVSGWSNDDYRAWSNDLHVMDIDEYVQLGRMDRLNVASRGKCTGQNTDAEGDFVPGDDPSPGSDDDASTVPLADSNGADVCEEGGVCAACRATNKATGDILARGGITSEAACEALNPDPDYEYKWATHPAATTREECQAGNKSDELGDEGLAYTWISNDFELGDGYLDLYPMWGFKTDTKEIIDNLSDGFIKTTVRGDPIMGLFHDDDPYRDFDVNDGIYSTKQYYHPSQGSCSDTARKFDKFGDELRYEDYWENCLYEKVCETVDGEITEQTRATGNTYTFHCYHPYAKQFAAQKSFTNENGNPDQVMIPLGTSQPDGGAFNCIFCDKPDPASGRISIRQKMAGGCPDDAYSSKWDCNDNAICKNAMDEAATPTTHEECVTQGLCMDTFKGIPVADDPDVVGPPENNQNSCEEYAEAIGVGTSGDIDWVWNKWTGWDEGQGDLVKPYTASIPINFEIVERIKTISNFGPYDSKHHLTDSSKTYYYATVTELRHAATDQDSWMEYLELHDSWLPCKMGWKECIMDAPSKNGILRHGFELMHSTKTKGMPFPPSIAASTKMVGTVTDPYDCESRRGGDLNPEEKEDMEKDFLYRLVKEIATNYYGRSYLMPLPFTPPLEEGCSTNEECLEEGTCSDEGAPDFVLPSSGIMPTNETDCLDAKGVWNEDNKGNSVEDGGKRIGNRNDCNTYGEDHSIGTTWHTYDNKKDCEEAFHQWGHYGLQSEWLTTINKDYLEEVHNLGDVIEESNFELRWDVASEGWPFNTSGFCQDVKRYYNPHGVILEANSHKECDAFAIRNDEDLRDFIWVEDVPILDNDALKKNLRYPASANFWTTGGNLEAFVAFPKTEIQRLRGHYDVSPNHEVSFREFDPEGFHHDENSSIALSDAAVNGTVFVKASVDPKTYWLLSDPTWEQQHLKFYERQCYDEDGELIPNIISEKECLREELGSCAEEPDDPAAAPAATAPPSCNEWRGRKVLSSFIKPYALITLDASARYDKPDIYKDKRAQHFPDGEPFENDCRDIVPRCMGFNLSGDPEHRETVHTKEDCNDEGGTWQEKEAIHRCAYEKNCCEWVGNNKDTGVCVDALGERTTEDEKEECNLAGVCLNIEDSDNPFNVGSDNEEDCRELNQAAVAGRCRDADNNTVSTDNKDDCLALISAGGACPEHGGPCVWRDPIDEYISHEFKYNEFVQQPACVAEFTDEDGKKLCKGVTLCIPLTKLKDSRFGPADLKAAFINLNQRAVEIKTSLDVHRMPMISAKFKPYYGGVPQQSNRYFWGPWGRGQNWGRVLYVNDSDFHPAAFAAESMMGTSARSRCLADINELRVNQEVESGSVTISGPPFYKLGDFVSFSGLPPGINIDPVLMSFYSAGPPETPFFGPLLTDMSIDVGSEGITTTYTMQRQVKFGNLAAIYEKRMREAVKRINALKQKQEEDLRRSRLPDRHQFRKNYKDK